LLEEEGLEEIIEKKSRTWRRWPIPNRLKGHMAYNEGQTKPSFCNPEPLKTLEEIMENSKLYSDRMTQKTILVPTPKYATDKDWLRERREKQRLIRRKRSELRSNGQQSSQRRLYILFY